MSGKRRKVVVVVVFLAIFVFLSLPVGVSRSVKQVVTGLFSPLFSVTRAITDKVSDIWSATFHGDNPVRENLRKQREILRLRAELALAREKIRDLGSLHGQLQQVAASGFEVIPARATVREPDSLYQTLVIDRGARDGVEMRAPVLHGDSLVGRVTEVGGRWCRVRLILDPESAIPAVTLNGHVRGIVVGSGTGPLKMTFIQHNAEVQVGETAVTAHQGKVLSDDEAPLPQGLVIGKVVGVTHEEEGLYQSATLESEVDFRKLKELLVVVRQ